MTGTQQAAQCLHTCQAIDRGQRKVSPSDIRAARSSALTYATSTLSIPANGDSSSSSNEDEEQPWVGRSRMTLRSYTHVALRVESLREAEAFYRELFALEVAFREAETSAGWQTLPPSAGWEEAERAGINLGLVMLYRDGLRLALEAVEKVAEDGRLSHVGVFASADELQRLRVTAPVMGCEIASDRPQGLIFDDPLGVRWEMNSFPYDDPPSMSTGARTGRWLEINAEQLRLLDLQHPDEPQFVRSQLVVRQLGESTTQALLTDRVQSQWGDTVQAVYVAVQ